MFTPVTENKVIVIDTEQYAGNFERQLCAFITGQYGECGVGSDIADRALPGIQHFQWWKENIAQESDDNDVYRPALIWPTPGWFNNGMGGHYRDVPENYAPARELAIQKHTEYLERSMANALDRLDRNDFEEDRPGAWTKEACERMVHQTREQIKRLELDPPRRAEAYLSVAIAVLEFPPQEILDEVIERALEFASDTEKATENTGFGEKTLTVTGFRLLDPTRDFEEEFRSSSENPAP